MKRVVVCNTHVPFAEGGAELHTRELVSRLRRAGHLAELVSLPFKWYPPEEIMAHAAAWRLLDLSESGGQPIDLLVASRFPSYFVRHPNKVSWLVHQYRPAYELCGTEYSEFTHSEKHVALRAKLMTLDREMLLECRRRFAISRTTAARLEKFNGVAAHPLYHPPPLADRLRPGPYGDYVLLVGRVERIKRVELGVRAMQYVDRPTRLLVVGDGRHLASVRHLVEDLDVGDRVTLLGRVDDARLIDLYAGALAIFYPPYNEDYGYVTLEAYLAHKPVITTNDSGGPLEFVEDGVSGVVCRSDAEAVAVAINTLAADRVKAAALGDVGFERVRPITWDAAVETLLSDA